jgi:Zn-dependent protease
VEDIDLGRAVMWFVVFLFSTTVHEAMHAWVALRGGDPTAYLGGQVSLSPMPHIKREPIGMLLVPLLTAFTQGWAIGWASTPYDPRWAERHPQRAALMSAAGPAGNLLIGVVSFGVLRAGLATGILVAPERVGFHHLVEVASGNPMLTGLAQILTVLLILNVLLFVFNLLPFPPLDGASALGLVLPARAAAAVRGLAANPIFSLVGLLIAWQLFPSLTRPIFRFVLALMHPGERYW